MAVATYDTLVSEHLERIGRGELITPSDIAEFLAVIPEPHDFVLLTRWGGSIVRALCFERRRLKTHSATVRPLRPRHTPKPNTSLKPAAERRYSKISALLEAKGLVWRNAATLLMPDMPETYERQRIDIQRHVNFLIVNTQLWKNLHKDLANLTASKLRAEGQIRATSVEALCDQLSALLSCSCVIVDEYHARWRDFPSPAAVGRQNRSQLTRGYRASIVPEVDRDFWDFHLHPSRRSEMLYGALDDARKNGKVIDLSGSAWVGEKAPAPFNQFLVIPFARATEHHPKRAQLLFAYRGHGTERFVISEVIIIQETIAAFLETQSFEAKAEVLQKLSLRISQLRAPATRLDGAERLIAFATFAGNVCQTLVRVTQSHSATVRMFDATSRSLAPIAFFHPPSTDRHNWPPPEPIEVRQWHTSAVAQAFRRTWSHPGGIYVPNVRQLTQAVTDLGLIETMMSREQTQSSISIPFAHGGTPLGVLHLESPYLSAFDADQAFLGTVAQQLGLYHSVALMNFDAQFVADKLSYFSHTHDLINFADRIEHQHPEIAHEVREVMGLMQQFGGSESGDVTTFTIADILAPIYAIRRPEGPDETLAAQASVYVGADVPSMRGGPMLKRALGYILENLFSNMVRHAGKTKLHVGAERIEPATAADRVRTRTRFLLWIDYLISPRLEPAVENSVLFEPIVSAKGERLGLYLVGLIARILGGHVSAMPTDGGRKSLLSIRIPLHSDD